VSAREDERLGGRVAARMQVSGGMDQLMLVRCDPLVLGQPIDRQMDRRSPYEEIGRSWLPRPAAAANYLFDEEPHAAPFAAAAAIPCETTPPDAPGFVRRLSGLWRCGGRSRVEQARHG
jgi:hypothetical protein